MTRRRIGIFGGTFDPIHLGHLAVAEGVRHLAQLDQVLLVPAVSPPHKQGLPLTDAHHRLEMVKLAIAGNPALGLSTVEWERPGPHYTVDTLAILSEQMPDAALHFITGLDGLLQIDTWHEYQRLLTGWPILAVGRPGYSLEAWHAMRDRLGSRLTARVEIHSIPGVAVSGQELRARAGAGYPLRYLVPEDVRAYIDAHRLYQSGGQ